MRFEEVLQTFSKWAELPGGQGGYRNWRRWYGSQRPTQKPKQLQQSSIAYTLLTGSHCDLREEQRCEWGRKMCRLEAQQAHILQAVEVAALLSVSTVAKLNSYLVEQVSCDASG